MARHRLVQLKTRFAKCKCGWHTDLTLDWGSQSAQNELLDRYNAHRSKCLAVAKRRS